MANADDSLLPDLARLLGPDGVLTDPETLAVYDADAFPLARMAPRAVAFPTTTGEVSAVMRRCHELGVPVVPRGAGTGLSGGAVPVEGGVLIEMARMNRILEISATNRYAVVEPGVVNVRLSQAAAEHGLHFAPDPSSQTVSTIGGNAAENAGGPHCLKHGMTTDHVLGAEVVLADGEIVEVGGPTGDACGYDLTALLVGSEGTLGVFTKLTVRLTPAPRAVRTLLADFPVMREGCGAVGDILAAGIVPAALEALDRGTIGTIEASPDYSAGFPTDVDVVLLVELDGLEAGLDAEVTRVSQLCKRRGAREVRVAVTDADRTRLWKGRKSAFGAMGRLSADVYILDGTVPRSHLPDLLDEVAAAARRHQLTICNIFHAGDGNLHPNISFDSRDAEQTRRVVAAGGEILEACVRVGGSISGEHGIGLEKLDFMPMLFSRRELDEMQALKQVFDPAGRLNPGKLLPTGRSCAESRIRVGRA